MSRLLFLMPRGGFGGALTTLAGRVTGFLFIAIAAGLWSRLDRLVIFGEEAGDGEPVRRAWRARQVPRRPLPARDGDDDAFSVEIVGSSRLEYCGRRRR
jgi:hypothetical protein